jgi:hypothetical protein
MTRLVRALGARGALMGQVGGAVAVLLAAWVMLSALIASDEVSPAMVVPLVLFAGLALAPMGRELGLSRESELTLLRLRGVRPLRLVWRCLAEPLPVVLAAAAVGVGLGALLVRLLAPHLAGHGHGPGPAWDDGALWLGIVGLACAALVALTAGMLAVLLDPVGRYVTGAPARPRRAWPAAVARVALLATTTFVVYDVAEDSQQLPAWEVWAGPILIGLVVAELLILLLPRLARMTARLAEPSPLPRWLALRRVGRWGPAAAPVRLLIAAGVLAGFAASGAISTSDWVVDAARVQNGAAYQFVIAGSTANAIALTERLDADGDHLVAAALLPPGSADDGRAGWVDAARYERVIGDELAGTGASGVPATMPGLGTEATSGVTTSGTFTVAGRFASGRPGTTVRLDLEYLTGTNDMETATITLPGQRGDRFESEAELDGCDEGCALASLTIRSDAPANVVFDTLANGSTELVGGDWVRSEPSDRSATMVGLGGADLYILEPPRYADLRPEGLVGPVPVLTAGDDIPPYQVTTAGGDKTPVQVIERSTALPLVGGDGTLGDLRRRAAESPTIPSADVLVLANAGTPGELLDAVTEEAEGGPTSVAGATEELGRTTGWAQPQALAGLAVACFLLAILTGLCVVPRLRRAATVEQEALRGVGVSFTTWANARRLDAAAVAVGAAGAVALGTLAATRLLLPELPLTSVGGGLAPWSSAPVWWAVAVSALAVALVAAWVLAGGIRRNGSERRTASGARNRSGLVAIVLRGLRSRFLLSAGVLLLTALAVGSAVLGPTFTRAATSSYLVTRIGDAPPSATGLTWTLEPGPDSPSPEALVDAGKEQLASIAGGHFQDPTAQLESGLYRYRDAQLDMLSKPNACAHLDVTGRCPADAGEAMMRADDLATLGLELSDDVPGPPGVGQLRIVGTYEVPEGEDDYWFETQRLASSPRVVDLRNGTRPFQPAPLIVEPGAFDRMDRLNWLVRYDARLDAGPSMTADDLESAAASAEDLGVLNVTVDGGRLRGQSALNDLPAIADDLSSQQAIANNSITPAMISLILVALAMLLRLLLAENQLRVPELALASLRGISGRRLWLLALAEPLLLIAAAVPLGIAFGLGAVRVLARSWLVPGLPLTVPTAGTIATVLVVLAALVVSAGAIWQLLRVPLAEQLSGVHRPAPARPLQRTGRPAFWLVLTFTTALLVARIFTSGGVGPDVIDLLMPVVLAAIAGMAASYAVVSLARWLTRRQSLNRSLAGFVSVRTLSRRRENALVILPFTVAVAICVFAVAIYGAAASWRESVTATKAPGDVVWSSDLATDATFDLARATDPDGRWLMAASVASFPGATLVLVDGSRLDRTTWWPEQWTPGTSAADIGRALAGGRPPGITGERLAVTVDNSSDGGPPVYVTLDLHPSEGGPQEVSFGPFAAGETTRSVAVPACAAGCDLERLSVAGDSDFPLPMAGTFTLSIDQDGEPWAGLEDAEDWFRPASTGETSPVTSVQAANGAAVLEVDTGDAADRAVLQPVKPPERVPVVVGEDATLVEDADGDPAMPINDGDVPVDPQLTPTSMPLAGPSGLLADYRQFTALAQVFDNFTDNYVLARADTPDEVTSALVKAGLERSGTHEQEQRVQDSSAYALALRLYGVVAVLVLLMALAGLAISTAVQLPARRRDAASLRVVGVPPRTILRSVAAEQLGVLGASALAGLVSGVVAAQILLRSITLGTVENRTTPSVTSDIDWWALLLQAAVALTVLTVSAVASALLTVRGARGSTLRESG